MRKALFTRARFEEVAGEEFDRVPERFKRRLDNVVLLVEEDSPGGELLGEYHGVPQTARGEFYSGALPDTITLYFRPLLEEAQFLLEERRAQTYEEAVRLAIRETLWHEIGHYFGLSDPEIHEREDEGTNEFR
ncbi:MAG TPA: metallopeptidase family protein [Candidatus Paceibacterota bacterium]|nr:metallopeptidase family protein [Candidatus Paceibacterota bacterium]